MQVGERQWLLRGAVFGLAIAVALITWLLTRGDGEEAGPEEARIVSVQELAELAGAAGYPIYWAGEIRGKEIQFVETGEGVSISYVNAVGEEPALTIASYPDVDATSSLESFANQPGSSKRYANGRGVIINSGEPANVYFASPDNRTQVEIYGAAPQRVQELALSTQVQPIG